MKIEMHEIKAVCIEKFADEHGLVMQVFERNQNRNDPSRYYAHFKGAEVAGNPGILISMFGNGPTPAAAIRNYAREISNKTLVIDAMKPTRREIGVPQFLPNCDK